MKTIIFFTTLLIFLHTTTYHMIGTEAKDGPPHPVLDVDGNPLLGQYIYYVLPAVKGPTSINSRPLMGNQTCTFGFGVSLEPTALGLAVGFYQPYSLPGAFFRESTDTNIRFLFRSVCNFSGVWKVDRQDPSTGQYFIVIDGVAGSGSANFWIEKVEVEGRDNCYKIRYCPQPPIPCFGCPLNCNDLDFVNNNVAGQKFLAVAETSYPFQFRRYESQAESY